MPTFALLLNYDLKNDGFDSVIAESAAAGSAELNDAASDVLLLGLNMAESFGSGV
jgi:DNA-binding response OmpR family regulator